MRLAPPNRPKRPGPRRVIDSYRTHEELGMSTSYEVGPLGPTGEIAESVGVISYQTPWMVSLPERAVTIGDRWRSVFRRDVPLQGNVTLSTEHEFLGPGEVHGRPCHRIRFRRTMPGPKMFGLAMQSAWKVHGELCLGHDGTPLAQSARGVMKAGVGPISVRLDMEEKRTWLPEDHAELAMPIEDADVLQTLPFLIDGEALEPCTGCFCSPLPVLVARRRSWRPRYCAQVCSSHDILSRRR